MELALSLEKLTNEKLLGLHGVRFFLHSTSCFLILDSFCGNGEWFSKATIDHYNGYAWDCNVPTHHVCSVFDNRWLIGTMIRNWPIILRVNFYLNRWTPQLLPPLKVPIYVHKYCGYWSKWSSAVSILTLLTISTCFPLLGWSYQENFRLHHYAEKGWERTWYDWKLNFFALCYQSIFCISFPNMDLLLQFSSQMMW